MVVPEGDADRLTEVIAHWADDPAEARRVGLRGREIFEQRYTQQIGLQRYQEILES